MTIARVPSQTDASPVLDWIESQGIPMYGCKSAAIRSVEVTAGVGELMEMTLTLLLLPGERNPSTPAARWVRTLDEQPASDDAVLTLRGRTVSLAICDEQGRWFEADYVTRVRRAPTHWMTIPEFPVPEESSA